MIASGTLLNAVITINSKGMIVINTYKIIKTAAIFLLRDEGSSGDLDVSKECDILYFSFILFKNFT